MGGLAGVGCWIVEGHCSLVVAVEPVVCAMRASLVADLGQHDVSLLETRRSRFGMKDGSDGSVRRMRQTPHVNLPTVMSVA